jgi:hypothetical protein
VGGVKIIVRDIRFVVGKGMQDLLWERRCKICYKKRGARFIMRERRYKICCKGGEI